MDTKKIIADRIKMLRKELNLTQVQLSVETGITLKSIRNYENCVTEPNSKNMAALERFFDVSGDYLRGETNNRNTVYAWEDQEIMNEVYNSFSFMFKNMLSMIRSENDQNQKTIFNIFVSLQSIMGIKNDDVRSMILERAAMDIYNDRNLADKMSVIPSKED